MPARGSTFRGQYLSVTTIAGLSAGGQLDGAAYIHAPAASAPMSRGEAFVACAHEVYRFILVRVGGDREAAEELLQECCRRAAAHRRPPVDPTVWPAWFCGIARNLIRRHWRRLRRHRERAAEDYHAGAGPAERLASEPLPDEVLVAAETVRELMFAIGRLSDRDQDLICEFYFEDRSCADIATERRTSAKAIETRLRRARRRLRAILEPQGAA